MRQTDEKEPDSEVGGGEAPVAARTPHMSAVHGAGAAAGAAAGAHVEAWNWMALKRDSFGTVHMTRSWNLKTWWVVCERSAMRMLAVITSRRL